MKGPCTAPTLLLCVLVAFAAAAAEDTAGTYKARIVGVGSTFGNLHTDLQVSNLGIEKGQDFLVTCREQTFDATLVDWYGDVESGAWVGLTNPDGSLQIAINNGDADQASGCGQDDALTITVSASP